MPGSLAPAKKSHSTFCLYTVVLLKCGFVFLWVTWFSWYNMAVQFIPLMSKFQGPKCQEMRFPAFDFQKFSQGSMPPDPQKMVGWNPSYASPRTVYFSGNSGYLKPKENSRCSLFCSPKFPIWALCLINFVTNCTNGAFTAESLRKQTLQSLRSMWRFFVSVMTCTFCNKNRENFF